MRNGHRDVGGRCRHADIYICVLYIDIWYMIGMYNIYILLHRGVYTVDDRDVDIYMYV